MSSTEKKNTSTLLSGDIFSPRRELPLVIGIARTKPPPRSSCSLVAANPPARRLRSRRNLLPPPPRPPPNQPSWLPALRTEEQRKLPSTGAPVCSDPPHPPAPTPLSPELRPADPRDLDTIPPFAEITIGDLGFHCSPPQAARKVANTA